MPISAHNSVQINEIAYDTKKEIERGRVDYNYLRCIEEHAKEYTEHEHLELASFFLWERNYFMTILRQIFDQNNDQQEMNPLEETVSNAEIQVLQPF